MLVRDSAHILGADYEIHVVDDRVTACPKCPFRSSTRNLPQERLRNWQVRQHDTSTLHSVTSLLLVCFDAVPRRFTHTTALQPSRKKRVSSDLFPSSSPKTSITLHLVTACSLQTAFRMKLYIWWPSFRR